MSQHSHKKINRNDHCLCGSGKKYKHCCGKNSELAIKPRQELQKLLTLARNYAYQQVNFSAAEQCYRDVLSLQPNNVEALAGVGQGLCWRHRKAEGRQYLLKAAKAMIRYLEKTEGRVLLELADQLQMWGEIEVALQLSRAALRKMPNNPSAHFGVASCLHRLNFTDDAIKVMYRVLQLVPNDAGCQILMALLEVDKVQFSQAQQRLENVVATEKDPSQLARGCLELAKVYDKLKRHDDAFALLIRSGELHKQLQSYKQLEPSFIFDRLELFKRGYQADLLTRWQADDFADDLPCPVFLIGFLRSGTTLTEQVLSAHPEIITSDENHLIDEVVIELEKLSGIKANSPESLRKINLGQARHLRQFYWQRAKEEYGQQVMKKRFVNKVALNSIETGLISTLFPDAKILFALRDPRDICLSCAMQSFTLSPATVNMVSWQGIAKQYAAVMDLWLTLRDKIQPAFLELRYEDTVTDFEASFKKVFALLDLTWCPDVLRFQEKLAGKYIATPSFAAVTQPIYQTAVARWQSYLRYFEPIQPILEPYIVAFGYI